MNSHLEQDANMSGVYVRTNGSSMLSFDGSESRDSVDDSKKGNCYLVICLLFIFSFPKNVETSFVKHLTFRT